MTILLDVNAENYNHQKSGVDVTIDNTYTLGYFHLKLYPLDPLPNLVQYMFEIGVPATKEYVDNVRKIIIPNKPTNKIKLLDNKYQSLILKTKLDAILRADTDGSIPLRGIIYITEKRWQEIFDFFEGKL